jgi:hypothetical protein
MVNGSGYKLEIKDEFILSTTVLYKNITMI